MQETSIMGTLGTLTDTVALRSIGGPPCRRLPVLPRPRAWPRRGMGGSRGMFTLAARRVPRFDCPRATMQGARSVCGLAARSPLIPRSPLSRGPRAPRRSLDHARPGRPAACPNLAYLVSRSPEAPQALLAARKMLQREELSGRHPNPAESRLLASVGRDRTISLSADSPG
jgi:hypothetical protein